MSKATRRNLQRFTGCAGVSERTLVPRQLTPGFRASMLIGLATVVLLSLWSFYQSNSATHTTRDPQQPASAASSTVRDGPVIVRATAHEFFWHFRFPGQDAAFDTCDDVYVQRELHLPLGRDIHLSVTSDDFVYTLAIPELGLRQLAVPDLVFHLPFQTKAEGSFAVIADPLCGVKFFHDEDMGRVVIQSGAAFDAWYESVQ